MVDRDAAGDAAALPGAPAPSPRATGGWRPAPRDSARRSARRGAGRARARSFRLRAERRPGRAGWRARPRPSRRRREVAVLAEVHDQRAEIARIGQRAAHRLRVGDAEAGRRRRRRRRPRRAGRSRRSRAPRGPWSAPRQGSTRTLAVSRARRRMKSTTAGSSTGGLVSGRATSVVTPPAAAAALALAMVSRCSAPGSPMKARMSIRPGATTSPPHSTIRASARTALALHVARRAPRSCRRRPARRRAIPRISVRIDQPGVEKGDGAGLRHGHSD